MVKDSRGWAHPVSQSAHRMNAELGKIVMAHKLLTPLVPGGFALDDMIEAAKDKVRSTHEEFKAAYYAEHPKGR